MLEHSVGPGPVEAGVGDRQVVHVGQADLHGCEVGRTGAGPLDHCRVVVDAEHRAGGGDRRGERREVGARAAAEVDRAVSGAEGEGVQHDPLVGAGEVHGGEPFLVPDPVGHCRLEHALGDPCGGLQLPLQDLAAGSRQAQGALASGLVQGLDQVLGLQARQGA